ncbi:phage portal protein [Lentzea terrae]|uniref:phage portal protein n=1 Tax=Lentzea terrae TaxID=2200761 RepID=UPI0022B8530B|nr:phage portal protein [Lentzea terrae]
MPVGSDYETYKALVGNDYASGRVTRDQIRRIPAFRRARDLICGVPAQLPLHAIRERDGKEVSHDLLVQPESPNGLVRVVTVARTLEDLWYDSRSLWLVLQRNEKGFPTAVERIPVGEWTQDEDGLIRVRGRELRIEDGKFPGILFISPADPMVESAAPTVKRLLRLEAAVELYNQSPEAAEYFTAPGILPNDPMLTEFLTAWNASRQARSTGFIPDGVERHEVQRMTPQELSLIDSREFEIKECARCTGIDPSWLAVNQTTRSYTNEQDIRRAFTDLTVGLLTSALEQRLSLNDVTPRGHKVLINWDAFLRGNTKERYETYKIAAEIGQITGKPPVTGDEIRELENRSPLGDNNNGEQTDE